MTELETLALINQNLEEYISTINFTELINSIYVLIFILAYIIGLILSYFICKNVLGVI